MKKINRRTKRSKDAVQQSDAKANKVKVNSKCEKVLEITENSVNDKENKNVKEKKAKMKKSLKITRKTLEDKDISKTNVELKNKSLNRTTEDYYYKFYNNLLQKHMPLKDSHKFSMAYPLFINPYQKDKICKLNNFISCFSYTKDLIYVGMKENTDPFNVFDVKEGKSIINILDFNLNVVDTLLFNFGDVMQIKCNEGKVYVLFSNGNLIFLNDYIDKLTIQRKEHDELLNRLGNEKKTDSETILENKTGSNTILENKTGSGTTLENELFDGKYKSIDLQNNNTISRNPLDRNIHVVSLNQNNVVINEFEIISDKSIKAISFDVLNSNIVYTNGMYLYCNNKSIKLNCVILQIIIYDNFIYFLDANYRIIKLSFDFKFNSQIFSNYNITQIKKHKSCLLAICDDDYVVLDMKNEDASKLSFFGFFVPNKNGIIKYNKRNKGKRNGKRAFQIIDNENTFEILNDESKFSTSAKTFIPSIVDFENFVLCCTENGHFCKLHYT